MTAAPRGGVADGGAAEPVAGAPGAAGVAAGTVAEPAPGAAAGAVPAGVVPAGAAAEPVPGVAGRPVTTAGGGTTGEIVVRDAGVGRSTGSLSDSCLGLSCTEYSSGGRWLAAAASASTRKVM